jgi:hypothetical protein
MAEAKFDLKKTLIIAGIAFVVFTAIILMAALALLS